MRERMPSYKVMLTAGLAASALLVLQCQTRPPLGTAQSAMRRIVSTKVLRIGYIVFPPTITKDLTTGRVKGHHVDTVEEIARQAGWKTEYVEADWSTFAAGLSTERFDVSIAPTFVTIPRALAVSFTRPLFYAGNSAVVRKDETRFRRIGDLDSANVTIAVTQGEAGHEYAKANLKRAKLLEFPGADQSLAFQAVTSGRADVALGDAHVTSQFVATHSAEVVDLFAGNPYNLTPVSWSVRLGDSELLSFLNASLEALETQGKLEEFERAAGAHWLHPKRAWIVGN